MNDTSPGYSHTNFSKGSKYNLLDVKEPTKDDKSKSVNAILNSTKELMVVLGNSKTKPVSAKHKKVLDGYSVSILKRKNETLPKAKYDTTRNFANPAA